MLHTCMCACMYICTCEECMWSCYCSTYTAGTVYPLLTVHPCPCMGPEKTIDFCLEIEEIYVCTTNIENLNAHPV